MDSRIQQVLPLESRILGIELKKIWNPAFGLEFGTQVPLSKNPDSSTQNPDSKPWNLESKTVLDFFTWGKQETEKEILVIVLFYSTQRFIHCVMQKLACGQALHCALASLLPHWLVLNFIMVR